MEKVIFVKPVIDLLSTGCKIKQLRTESGFTVQDIKNVFGFEYPQAVYAWEQGKTVPTIDNLLVLARLYNVSIDEMIVTRNVEVEIICTSDKIKKLCNKKCDSCKYKLTA